MQSKGNKSKEKKASASKKRASSSSKKSNSKSKKRNISKKSNSVSKSNKGKNKKIVTKKLKSKIRKFIKNKFLDMWVSMKDVYFSYDPSTAKVFSDTCNLMTLSIVVLCTLFVYVEDSFLYTFPLITVLATFIKFGRGNRYSDSSERDLVLYKKILLANLFVVLAVFLKFQEELWFINFFMILIFIVPLLIARYFEY